MSSIADIHKPISISRSVLADYVSLAKPRISFMVLVTTAVGYVIASQGHLEGGVWVHLLLGTAMAAAGANALNMLVEHHLDALMERTCGRPLPSGRLQRGEVLAFGLFCSVAGVAYLAAAVNLLTSLLCLFIVLSYVCLYTPLKTRTSFSTVVGAVPGAMPPLLGWAAARNSLDIEACLLFSIMFLWQLPHFLAIGWKWRHDYRRAGFPLLPVIDPEGYGTARQMLLQTFGLILVSLLPTVFGKASGSYFCVALVLGLVFMVFGIGFALQRTDGRAHKVFVASIVYLPLLFGFLTLDKTIL